MTEAKVTLIDPRGPRFGATIINILSIVIFFLALAPNTELLAFALLLVATLSFVIGTIWGNTKHPFGWLFRKLVKPRLSAPVELEDSRPPQFAQGVGLVVSLLGVVLHLIGNLYGVAIASGLLIAATTLQAYFGYCLGCQIYLGLKRLGA